MTGPTGTTEQANLNLILEHGSYHLINQVGFSGFFKKPKRDVTYRNDPTVEELVTGS